MDTKYHLQATRQPRDGETGTPLVQVEVIITVRPDGRASLHEIPAYRADGYQTEEQWRAQNDLEFSTEYAELG